MVGRQIWRRKPWHVWAATLVREDEELVVAWLPRGSDWLKPVGSLFGDWTHELHPFAAGELRLNVPGRDHSINLFWNPDDTFKGWYVNLERDLRVTDEGFDYEDQLLDIWVEPDGSWRWIDEDELEEAVDRGLYSKTDAEAIRAEGERVLAEWPFPTGWEEWQPDPSWPLPRFPDHWRAPGAAQ